VAPGRTWSSGRVASCAKATRIPRCRSSTTSPRARVTPSCGFLTVLTGEALGLVADRCHVRCDPPTPRPIGALKRAHGDAKARIATERRACEREIAATGDQLALLDTALARIAARAAAPFTMSIGGRAYSERGPASSALVEARAGSTAKASVGVRRKRSRWRRGLEVRASRLLTSDEVMLSLSIPCRTGRCTRRTSLAARPMASVWCDASRTWLTRSLPTVRRGCRRNLLRLRHRMTLPIDNIIHICEHLSLC